MIDAVWLVLAACAARVLAKDLDQDPRRAGSKYEPNRVYHLAFAGLDISFTVDKTQLTVVAVNDAQD